MTYMSIHVAINQHLRSGRLQRILPIVEEPAYRFFHAVPEVVQLLTEAPSGDAAWDARRMSARADIDWFVGGHRIDVRMRTKNVNARLALLKPASDGVWEFRVRAPKPGIRIFGGFADRDVFVACSWSKKEELLSDDGSENDLLYGPSLNRCKTEWIGLFAPLTRMTGGTIHDYISRKKTLLD